MKQSLKLSEWTLVSSLLLIFASFFIIAKVNASRSSPPPLVQQLPIHATYPVEILGAVKKPGTYQIKTGMPLKQAIQKSSPHRFANLKGVDLEKRIDGPLQLTLEEMREISVRVECADELPQELIVPVRTRVCDLKAKIPAHFGIDKACFKSRRMLKDGEIVRVEKKSIE